MLKIAVTGASGFIGKHFIKSVLNLGWKVKALTRSDNLCEAHNLEIIKGSLENPPDVNFFKDVDVFVHLAALGVQSRDRIWDQVIQVNVQHSLKWIQEAQRCGVQHAVVAGSALEYQGFGTLPDNPHTGEFLLCGERTSLECSEPYGASKAAGGLLMRAWSRNNEFPLWYLRLATCYGPNNKPCLLYTSDAADE